MRHYIPCWKTTTKEQLAKLFICYVWRYHGLPDTIISDRGPQFVSEFWKELCRILRIQVKLSTARHPQTDGQSEAANKALEIYLRGFVSHHQDDWVDWLPSAEFAENVNDNASTRVAPFELNYGFKPRMSFDWTKLEDVPVILSERDQRQSAREMTRKMDKIWHEAADALRYAQEKQAEAANKHREAVSYAVGDKVYLSADGIPDKDRPTEKLSDRWYGPFEVEELVGNSYKLKLPSFMKIHPVFHTEKLMRSATDPLPGQQQEPQGPVDVSDDGELEWEVEEVLDSSWNHPHRRGRKPRIASIWYLVKWRNIDEEDREWYPAANFNHAPKALKTFHDRYPDKPGPPEELDEWIARFDSS
jgi:Chromo (CHRromatin Organisation MOdifier) domain